MAEQCGHVIVLYLGGYTRTACVLWFAVDDYFDDPVGNLWHKFTHETPFYLPWFVLELLRYRLDLCIYYRLLNGGNLT